MFITVIMYLICNINIYFALKSREVKRWVDSLNKCGDFTHKIRQRLCKNVESLNIIFRVDTLHKDGDFPKENDYFCPLELVIALLDCP